MGRLAGRLVELSACVVLVRPRAGGERVALFDEGEALLEPGFVRSRFLSEFVLGALHFLRNAGLVDEVDVSADRRRDRTRCWAGSAGGRLVFAVEANGGSRCCRRAVGLALSGHAVGRQFVGRVADWRRGIESFRVCVRLLVGVGNARSTLAGVRFSERRGD